MFNRTFMALCTALVVANPALARLEDEADFAPDFTVSTEVDASYAQILNAGPACGQSVDVLVGYKSFLGKDTSYDDALQILMMTDGFVPNHRADAPIPVVGCS